MKCIIGILTLLIFNVGTAQNTVLSKQLFETYDSYKEKSLNQRRIKYKDIQPLIEKLKTDERYSIKIVGKSIEGRDINLISIGKGKINIFFWSQMHGDEPTATQALFDVFNFLNSDYLTKEKQNILDNVSLHFLPMLNPDGSEVFKRRNALDIDLNRDALRLQSPESQILKRIRDSLNADFGFNLHDQSRYNNTKRSDNTASISFLAPAYNYEKETNDVRNDAMKVIVVMNRILQKVANGKVGKYGDEFEPRAFGDNMQKWGTSTILIESGGFRNDIERQQVRKLNYVSILSAIESIANGSYKSMPLEEYNTIPMNDRKLFDLKIENLTYSLHEKPYQLDIGIKHAEVNTDEYSHFYNIGRIVEIGDLSTYYGYHTFDATGYQLVEGKVYPKSFRTIHSLSLDDVYKMLRLGYTYIRIKKLNKGRYQTVLPIHLIAKKYNLSGFELGLGKNATFLLKKDNIIKFAVLNGFLIDLNKKDSYFRNALNYR